MKSRVVRPVAPGAIELLLSVPPDAYTLHGHYTERTWILRYRRTAWWQGNTIESSGDVVRSPDFGRYCETVRALLIGREAQRLAQKSDNLIPTPGP